MTGGDEGFVQALLKFDRAYQVACHRLPDSLEISYGAYHQLRLA
ncbi:hypothetical protein NIES2104_34590 [Leptolyngbya sp. NIES-2104]|nr:hypothetical protein NIES2104_34590 [Leptolyngbya sp. NIES-2104]